MPNDLQLPSITQVDLAIQNEDSLSSVDISNDGHLLIVATPLRLKMFRLRFRDGSSLKIGRSDLPPRMSSLGAKIVKFSPDHRWLLIIRPDSTIELHRTMVVEGAKRTKKISEKCIYLRKLKRSRNISGYAHGTHGNYDRSISRVAFSADSRILAVADLSGYIDTWVLEGHEDLTQENVTTNGAASSESSDDEDTDSDEEHHPTIIFGQHWIRNPTASLIPKLDSTPLIFSFRPSKALLQPLINGHAALHATRHTPYPHSHDLPTGEDRLFVLTSEHNMYEFEVLAGRLTEWSRRNPTASLPAKFRIMDERAMGVIWDVSKLKQRIWLYGSSWLWMFDLSQDFSRTTTQPNQSAEQIGSDSKSRSKKRKRKPHEQHHQSTAQPPQWGTTGAGDQIPDSKLNLGIGRTVRIIEGNETFNPQRIDLGQKMVQTSGDDEYNAMDTSSLAEFRRTLDEEPNDEEAMDSDSRHKSSDVAGLITQTEVPRQQHWSTFKYRPILGVIPLSSEMGDVDGVKDNFLDNYGGDQDLEVALIERPLEEVDLPARFHGDQEWDENR